LKCGVGMSYLFLSQKKLPVHKWKLEMDTDSQKNLENCQMVTSSQGRFYQNLKFWPMPDHCQNECAQNARNNVVLEWQKNDRPLQSTYYILLKMASENIDFLKEMTQDMIFSMYIMIMNFEKTNKPDE